MPTDNPNEQRAQGERVYCEAFAWLYQWAGAMNAPTWLLDNLSALASGKPSPHRWKYPAMHDGADSLAGNAARPKSDSNGEEAPAHIDCLTTSPTPSSGTAAGGEPPKHSDICGADSLDEVYRHSGAASDTVIRWCRKCGAVVIDEDYDGRTNPGAYLTMIFPSNRAHIDRLTAENAELRKDKERLDWMDGPKGSFQQVMHKLSKGRGAITLRAAIDAALAPKPADPGKEEA